MAKTMNAPLTIARLLLPLSMLAGCNTLPTSGPVEAEILDDARKPSTNPLGFRVIEVDPRVVDVLATDTPPLMSRFYPRADDSREGGRIGPGDLLSISVFEIGSALFSSTVPAIANAVAPVADATTDTLPPMQVGSDGEIDMPYVGPLRASGRTPQELAEAIETGLAGKSQDPQVLVRILNDVSNSVIVSGDIRNPGREPLTLAHERLLDVIAIAGGPTYAPEDSIVQLTRRGRTHSIPLKTLEEMPDQNIGLTPGDRVEVLYQPRTFTVFGATSKVSQTPFDAPTLSLAEALARIGGPLDDRADPNAVFLFRFEKSAIARRLGLPVRPGVSVAPVVYQLDMMNPTSYFLAQQFAMKNKDLVYIANARSNALSKFINLISLITSPAITAAYLAKN